MKLAGADAALVLMVTPGYPPAVGGTEIQCARLGEALVARGARVRVITRGHDGVARSELASGVEVRRSRSWAGPRSPQLRAFNALAFLFHVAREVRRACGESGVIVHHHGLGMSLAVAIWAARPGRAAFVAKVLCGGSGGECARLRKRRFVVVRRALARVDRFVALQPALMQELLELGVAGARVTIVPNGVAVPERRGGAGSPARMVLFGGRLDPQKDLVTLLRAWARVAPAAPDARLVIAGEGSERPRLERLARELGVEGSVEIPGLVADYAERLAACALFVLPSRYEGMSNALLEAMVASRPCVVSDLPENRHTLGDAGVYVPAGDAIALARELGGLLADPGERGRLGERARSRAVALFSLDTVTERYLELYAQLEPAP